MPQERTGRLPISTVQAPHCWMPQPYLVPVRPTVSRIAQSNGVSSSTSTNRFLPLIFNSVISFSYNKVVELIVSGNAESKGKINVTNQLLFADRKVANALPRGSKYCICNINFTF
jgi:hypothetical protein